MLSVRPAATAVAVLALLCLLAGPARADVVVRPSVLPTAQRDVQLVVSVAGDAAVGPVRQLQLLFPGSVVPQRVTGPPGWTTQPKAGSFVVSGPARAGQIDVEVVLDTPAAPQTLVIGVWQTFANGTVIRWTDLGGNTAGGTVAVTAAPAVTATTVTSSGVSPAPTGSTAPATDDGGGSVMPWVVGLVLAAAAALVLMIGRRRRRNRAVAPPAPAADPAPMTAPQTAADPPPAGPPVTAGTSVAGPPPMVGATTVDSPGPDPVATGTPAAGITTDRPAAPQAAAATDGSRLAIDYGTSNTVALLRAADGRIRPLLFDASPLLPSAVQDARGDLITGRDALNAALSDPGSHDRHPKRRINEMTALVGGREHDVAALIAATLRRVADEAKRVTGAAVPTGTVLTHPAAWGTIRRDVLTDAAARAGFAEPVLIAEPVAAAAYYTGVLGHDLAGGRPVLIYDLGAGTFDVTVVRRDAGGFDVLAADGLDDLGGLDFDALIVQLIAEQAVTAGDGWTRLMRPDTSAERRFAQLLWDDARAAKETLSRLATAGVTMPSLGLDTHVTREQFEHAARPLVARTIRAAAAVMRAARVSPAELDGLFLVGGSTRIPLVATLLFQEFDVAPTVLDQPEIVVAEGALHYAADRST